MKAEINNEKKGRFFAIHWGQCILENDMHGPNGLVWSYNMNESIVKNSWLELKPLSQISDEDAIEVAKFMGFGGWSPEMAKAMIFTLFLVDSNDPIKEDLIIKQMLTKFSDISSTVDLFRSLGYAYEWMGLSVDDMIQAGWIKLTNK